MNRSLAIGVCNLPDDIKACHALIEHLPAELHAARDQIAKLQSADADAQDAAAKIAQLEALLARCRETIAEQEQNQQGTPGARLSRLLAV